MYSIQFAIAVFMILVPQRQLAGKQAQDGAQH